MVVTVVCLQHKANSLLVSILLPRYVVFPPNCHYEYVLVGGT